MPPVRFGKKSNRQTPDVSDDTHGVVTICDTNRFPNHRSARDSVAIEANVGAADRRQRRKTGFAVVLAALTLAGCDEPTVISSVDKLPHMKLTDLWTMQDGRGIPVEIHGSPWRNAVDRELAEAIRPPGGVTEGVQFYSAPVGSWQGGHAWRMVMHFNPAGPANAYQDCKRTEEAVTAERPETGYSVNIAFCKKDEWQAHGYLQVLKADAGDFEAYSNAVATALTAIFREDPGDQR